MLSSTAIHEEINMAHKVIGDKDASVESLLKVLVKLSTLNLKLLHNVRTNQTIDLKAKGIELKEPKTDDLDRRDTEESR